MYDFEGTNTLSDEKGNSYDYYGKAEDYWPKEKEFGKHTASTVKGTDKKYFKNRKRKPEKKDSGIAVPADAEKTSIVKNSTNDKHTTVKTGIQNPQNSFTSTGPKKTSGTLKVKSKTNPNGTLFNRNTKAIKFSLSKTKSKIENQLSTVTNVIEASPAVYGSQRNISKTRSQKVSFTSTYGTLPVTVNYISRGNITKDVSTTKDKNDLKVVLNAFTDTSTTITVNGSKAPETGGPPYMALLAGATAVLAISFTILLALYIYRRRKYGPSVISDDMYNAYKLHKKIESRSPLPSPRTSEQEGISEYDFIRTEDVGNDQTDEFHSAKDGTSGSVYIELVEISRYDYAEPPSVRLPSDEDSSNQVETND